MSIIDKEKRERNKFNVRLGNHIRKKRITRNITAAELARRCFMDKPNLLRIEMGRVNTSIYILYKISEGLEISLDELLKGFK
jgi:transcriptional regulator with XRE-family HTH domain